MRCRRNLIPTFAAIAGVMLLLGFGGVDVVAGGGAEARGGSDSHGHAHAHSHGGVVHVHTHAQAGPGCGVALSDEGDDEVGFAIVGALTPVEPHHCCCQCDHSHGPLVYALSQTGPRWQDDLPPAPCPLPDLWQPVATACAPVLPIPPPPRDGPGNPLAQLRTVVLLT